VPALSQISTMVALVSALIGFSETLPISLIQMSSRSLGSTGHFRPPAIIASLNRTQRCDTVPSGSPMENRVPSRCWITPGDLMTVAGYTTQPIARSGAITADVSPSGSTASIRCPSYGPGSLWKYHHGMPFCPATRAVPGPSRGASSGPAEAYECALSPRKT
jgi:hypothetical protein